MVLEPNSGNLSEYLSEQSEILEEVKQAIETASNDDATAENQDEQTEILQTFLDEGIATKEVPHKHFCAFSGLTGTSTISLPSANTEYLLFAFKLKTGVASLQMNAFQTLITSLSNDNLIVKVGIGKVLSAPLVDGDFVDVHPDSKLKIFKSAISNAIPRTVSGFENNGRDWQSFDIIANQQGSGNNDQETLLQGEIMYITCTPLSSSGLIRWIQNWEEPQ